MDPAERVKHHFEESAAIKLRCVEALAPVIARAAQLMTHRLLQEHRI
jgi:phosphoheptose isomerase